MKTIRRAFRAYQVWELNVRISAIENLLAFSTSPWSEGDLLIKLNGLKLTRYEILNE